MPLFIPGPVAFTRGARIALVVFTLVLVAAAAALNSDDPVRPEPARAAAARPEPVDWTGFRRTGDMRFLAPTSSLAGTTAAGQR